MLFTHEERMGKEHSSLTMCAVDLRVCLAPSNSVWCCTYANGGCGLIPKPLECTPGSHIQEI